LPLDGGPGPRHTVGAFPIFQKTNPAFPQWPFRKINDRAIVAYGRPVRALLRKRGWSRTTFYRSVESGVERIAVYLNAHGVEHGAR